MLQQICRSMLQQSFVSVGVSTGAGAEGEYLKRSHSDHDLYQGRNMEDGLDQDGGAEFYTEVAPDSKDTTKHFV